MELYRESLARSSTGRIDLQLLLASLCSPVLEDAEQGYDRCCRVLVVPPSILVSRKLGAIFAHLRTKKEERKATTNTAFVSMNAVLYCHLFLLSMLSDCAIAPYSPPYTEIWRCSLPRLPSRLVGEAQMISSLRTNHHIFRVCDGTYFVSWNTQLGGQVFAG